MANAELQSTLWQLKGVLSDMDEAKQKEITEPADKIIVALKENLEGKEETDVQLIFSLAMMQVMLDLDMNIV